MGIIRKLIDQQKALSEKFEKNFMPKNFLIDGCAEFQKQYLPKELEAVKAGSRVYDIGCGRHPAIPVAVKQKLNLKITGIDLSEAELLQAPPGMLDNVVAADICNYQGKGDGDLIVCQTLLEHVPSVEAAFASMSSILRPGGKALIFVPSRNAIFARLNLILPENIKRFLLFNIFPQSTWNQGFKSYYNRCTPRDFRVLAAQYGFTVEEMRTYYKSDYFKFIFPVHFVWRLWVLLFEKIDSEQAAETFTVKLSRI